MPLTGWRARRHPPGLVCGVGSSAPTQRPRPSWIACCKPPRHPLPELEIGKFYTVPISVGTNSNGDLFFRLRTNVDIQPDE